MKIMIFNFKSFKTTQLMNCDYLCIKRIDRNLKVCCEELQTIKYKRISCYHTRFTLSYHMFDIVIHSSCLPSPPFSLLHHLPSFFSITNLYSFPSREYFSTTFSPLSSSIDWKHIVFQQFLLGYRWDHLIRWHFFNLPELQIHWPIKWGIDLWICESQISRIRCQDSLILFYLKIYRWKV